MALESKYAREFSDRLIDWFWSEGVQREGIYTLSPSDWLRTLYTANERLRQAELAAQDPRPAFALWGPSQSGKSTLLSNFLDQKVWAKLRPKPDEWDKLADGLKVDGTASALYWPGSDPCIFLCDLPQSEQHRAEHVVTMNPFTGGKDASAVLTRFTPGSTSEEAGFTHVKFPHFPVSLTFLGAKQVLHALALGYETECYGMPRKLDKWVYVKKDWNRDEFLREIEGFESSHKVLPSAQPEREAYQIVYDLCEVLEDMVLAGVERFEKLMTSARNPGEWHGMIQSLLARKSLITDPQNAKEFAASLLWDGSPCISEQFNALYETLGTLQKDWAERTVHCSLKAAAWLLNMDAYERITNNPQSFPGLLIYTDAEHVFLAMGDQAPPPDCKRSGACKDAAQFARLQGLIWEMVMPINMENLPEKLENGEPNRFRQFLVKGDLLDFPGVSNVPKDKAKPLVAWPKEALDPDAQKELEAEQFFSDSVFFTKVLKHGKTASIVSAYAKRLKIDGFTIFMYLNQHPPPNANQIISGINTWWNRMVPDYNRQLGGRSPLPLNLALTWWRDLFENYASLRLNDGEYFASKQDLLNSLGRVSNPGVVWSTCALNYYRLPQGRPSRNSMTISELLPALSNERDFKTQFATAESRASFESMLHDHQTGGAAFLCRLLCQQLEQLFTSDQRNRKAILEEVARTQTEALERLLQSEFMLPPPEQRDYRKEHLKRFHEGMRRSLGLDPRKARTVGPERETEMRRLNYALRELLNVDYTDLETLPSAPHEITDDFIATQFRTWIRKQSSRWNPGNGSHAGSGPQWHLLGIGSSGQVEAYLTSMTESLRPQMKEAAEWLREVRAEQDDPHRARRVNYLPFLAVRMSNLLVGEPNAGFEDDAAPSYQVLIKPFVEQQLPHLIEAPVGPKAAVPVPGTAELRELCTLYGVALNGSDSAAPLDEPGPFEEPRPLLEVV
jgi:hypothetical protein